MPTAAYDRWLDRPAPDRWSWLAGAWLATPHHLSLAGAIDTRDKAIPPLLDRPPSATALARRALVLLVLTSAPAGRAVGQASLAARVDWQAPTLWEGGPAHPPTLISWACEEAEFTGVSAGGAVSTFGRYLIDGDSANAAAALGALAPPVTAEIILQADLTAVVVGELTGDSRRELELLADVESAGSATVYRFTEASLCRGFDAGRTSSQILGFLAEHAPKRVPQPLAYLVEDLGRRFGRMRVGSATCYLRCDDNALMAEVASAKKTSRLRLRLLAPTVATSDADPSAVERCLRDAGYMAATEDGDGALVLRRPSAHRAKARTGQDGELGDFDGPSLDKLTELIGHGELPEPASGLPPESVAGLYDEASDLAMVVQRLRHPAQLPARRARPGADASGALSQADPFPQLTLVDDDFLQAGNAPQEFTDDELAWTGTAQYEVDDDESARPAHIATGPEPVADLAHLACCQGWLTRLSYVSSQGAESEFYAEILDVGPLMIKVQRMPTGISQDLRVSRIRWARVATEAEEEAHLP
jgi:hypothetical protein